MTVPGQQSCEVVSPYYYKVHIFEDIWSNTIMFRNGLTECKKINKKDVFVVRGRLEVRCDVNVVLY